MKNNHKGTLSVSANTNIKDGIVYRIYAVRGDAITGKDRLLDENIKFQLAFREIEYGRHKTKLPEFMKEYFDTPKLMMSDTTQGDTINVKDMNNCFGKVDMSL